MRVLDPPLTADAIVTLLHALTGADELSHDQLSDQSANDHHADIHSHSDHLGITANQHHVEAHAAADHSDQTATGAELEALTDGSETALHTHTPLQSAILEDNRNMASASGDVTYNGFGFQPRAIIIVAAVLNGVSSHVGIVDSALIDYGWHVLHSTPIVRSGAGIMAEEDVNKYQAGNVSAFTSDGFTVTWTKVSTPVGSINFRSLCLR